MDRLQKVEQQLAEQNRMLKDLSENFQRLVMAMAPKGAGPPANDKEVKKNNRQARIMVRSYRTAKKTG